MSVASDRGRLACATLKRMAEQLRTVIADLEHNSMISVSTRAKMQTEMNLQLDALMIGASELARAYGEPPQIIEGTPFAKESGNA